MKKVIPLFLILSALNVYSQDIVKIKQIDSLITAINKASLPVNRDTLTQDYPELGLKMTTYIIMIVDGNELKKYVNNVNTTKNENGSTKQMTTSSSFYYDHNKLIKVEEFLIEDNNKREADWYYSDDKPLYYTLQSDKAKERAALLFTLSKTMLKQAVK